MFSCLHAFFRISEAYCLRKSPRSAAKIIYDTSDTDSSLSSSHDMKPSGGALKCLELSYNKDRCRRYRENMTEEKKQQYRESSKLRMRKLREKKRLEQVGKVQTRQEIKMQRKKWRDSKAQQMARLTPEGRALRLAARREQYKLRQLKKGKIPKNMPKSPDKFAKFVHNLVSKCSPRKKIALRMKGVTIRSINEREERKLQKQISESVRRQIILLKKKRGGQERKDLRVIVKALKLKKQSFIRNLGMRYVLFFVNSD